jgi:hypothetical protein
VRPQPFKIHVQLAELGQLFHAMDPSPFLERDLNDDVADFILGSALEGPRRARPELVVVLRRPAPPAEMDAAREAIRHFFLQKVELTQRELRELLRQGQWSLWVGLSFLAACLVGGRVLAGMVDARFADLVREGFLVGGWVAMWRPLEIYLYGWWPILKRVRVYRALAQMPVHITT